MNSQAPLPLDPADDETVRLFEAYRACELTTPFDKCMKSDAMRRCLANVAAALPQHRLTL